MNDIYIFLVDELFNLLNIKPIYGKYPWLCGVDYNYNFHIVCKECYISTMLWEKLSLRINISDSYLYSDRYVECSYCFKSLEFSIYFLNMEKIIENVKSLDLSKDKDAAYLTNIVRNLTNSYVPSAQQQYIKRLYKILLPGYDIPMELL